MKKKPIIPFDWLPGSWGLKGKTRKIAKAEYELRGYDLEKELAELKIEDRDKLNERLLEIDHDYGMISDEDYTYKKNEFIKDPIERAVAKIETDYKFKKINYTEYTKSLASAKQESWVSVIDLNARGTTGNFELDWNDYFIEELKDAGFTGMSDEDIVNSWFSRICRDIALSEYSGQGNFDEQLAEAENKKSNEEESKDGRRVIK